METYKIRLLVFSLVIFIVCLISYVDTPGQRKNVRPKAGNVCGNPQAKCPKGENYFKSHELAYEIPANSNVVTDSEFFYAVILKTVRLKNSQNCENLFPESERIIIQKLFPQNKVFALRCSDAGDIYYTNVNPALNFMGVFAGRDLPKARRFLKTVLATGKFKGANLRRMRAGINGT